MVFTHLARCLDPHQQPIQGGGSFFYPVSDSTLSWKLEARHTIAELNNLATCEQFPLCEHLQKKVGDISAGLLMVALEMESESLCGECPYFKVKEKSPT
jgi:hypothetical protein